jgi:succinate-semialdehyde dehydrogenase/glutarate-semialdehyde dehydrogenase
MPPTEIQKTVLELGGSDPFIVLDDADLNKAAEVAAVARLQNNVGQSCISAKRFIVHKKIVKKFTKLLVSEFEKLIIGDPSSEETDVGPLATPQVLADVVRQVKKSVLKGAKIVLGGKQLKMPGYFYPPTILTQVKKGMPVYDEEVFGPVVPIIEVKNEVEAIRVANDTVYGLGATIFTKDLARAKRLIPQIEAGNVFVNSMVKSDPRVPFGGIKRSGYGRELSSYGIKEFVNIKNVHIK